MTFFEFYSYIYFSPWAKSLCQNIDQLTCLERKIIIHKAHRRGREVKFDGKVKGVILFFLISIMHKLVFPGGSEVKASACNAGDLGSIPGSGRSPGEGNGNPLQYSCLENPMDRGAWWATVHGVIKSWARLSDLTYYA